MNIWIWSSVGSARHSAISWPLIGWTWSLQRKAAKRSHSFLIFWRFSITRSFRSRFCIHDIHQNMFCPIRRRYPKSADCVSAISSADLLMPHVGENWAVGDNFRFDQVSPEPSKWSSSTLATTLRHRFQSDVWSVVFQYESAFKRETKNYGKVFGSSRKRKLIQ